MEEVAGPAAHRFSECGRPPRAPSPPSPTSSTFLCSFFCPCMHAPPPPAWLLRLLLTAAMFSPSRHHHQTWRWRALSPYATYGGASESVPGCLFDGTGTLYRLFSVTRLKPQTRVHAQGKLLFSEGIPWARALLWEIESRQRVLCGETSTDPKHRCS